MLSLDSVTIALLLIISVCAVLISAVFLPMWFAVVFAALVVIGLWVIVSSL